MPINSLILDKKSHFYKKLPSRRSSLNKKFDFLLKLLLRPFNFKKPSGDHLFARMVSLKGEEKPAQITLNHFVKAHRDFLKHNSNSSSSLLNAFDRMEKNEKAIQTLNNGVKLFSEKKKRRMEVDLIRKNLRELKNLKPGQTSLFTLERAGLDSPKQVLIIERNQAHYEMKWIDSEEKLTIRNFTDIPLNVFESAEFKSLLQEWTTVKGISKPSFESFIQNSGLKESGSLTLTNRVDKLFWNIILKKETDRKQVKNTRINADAYLLFKYFSQNQNKLTPTSKEYFALKQLFEAVSARILQGVQKQNINEQELSSYVKELKIIEEALQRVTASKQSVPSSKAPRDGYLLKISSNRIKPPEPITLNEIEKNLQTIEKKEIAAFKYEGPGISLEQPPILQSLEDLKNELNKAKNLLEQKEVFPELRKHQLLRWVQYIPFNEDTVPFWFSLGFGESLEAQKMLYEITEDCFKGASLNTLNQYELAALGKLSEIMENLAKLWRASPGSRNIAKNIEHDVMKHELGFSQRFQWAIYDFANHSIDSDGIRRTFWQADFLERSFFNEDLRYRKNYFASFSPVWRPKKEMNLTEIKKAEEYLKKQNRLIAKITDISFGSFFNIFMLPPSSADLIKMLIPENQHQWIKPFQNPYLLALFQYAQTKAAATKKDESSPELFQAMPYETLEHHYDLLTNSLKALRKQAIPTKALAKPEVLWSKEEIQKILRVLSQENFSLELVALMVESPQFILDAELRNFMEALFFQYNDLYLKIDKEQEQLQYLIPRKKIIKDEQKVNFLNTALLKGLQQMQDAFEKELDPTARYKKLEAVLYFYEFHEKFRKLDQSVRIKSLQDPLNTLIEKIKADKTVAPLLGYAARIQLRQRIEPNLSDLNPDAVLNLVQSYGSVFENGLEEHLLDPYFEKYKDRLWIDLVKQLSQQKPDFKPILDSICKGKNLIAGKNAWQKIEGRELVYENDLYIVDLILQQVSAKNGQMVHTKLPQAILNHPEVKALNISDNIHNIIQVGDRYQFLDAQGTPTLIQQKKDQVTVFKQYAFAENKWLQHIQLDQKSEEEKGKGIFSQFRDLIGSKTKSNKFILNQCQIYINPANLKAGYAVNLEGELLFTLKLGKGKNGFEVKAVLDHRADPSTTFYQFTSGDKISDHRFFALEALDRPENMVIWSEKGKIRFVELSRYNLNFALVRGELVCKSKGFEDYIVDPEALINIRQGLKYVLVLRPKDERKPVRLIVPKATMLIEETILLRPEVSGFGHLLNPIYYASKLLDFVRGINQEEVMLNLTLDTKQSEIDYVTFDVRPFTQELINKNYPEQTDILDLMEQALKLKDPVAALKFYHKIDLAKLSTKQMQPIIDFLNRSIEEETAPIKLKISLDLYKHLKERKLLSVSLNKSLMKLIVPFISQVHKMGRRVPDALRTTVEDSESIIELSKGALTFNPSKFVDTDTELVKPAQSFSPKIELLAEPKPILFSKSTIDPLFVIREKSVPTLNVLLDLPLETFEKQALKEFQTSLDNYESDQEYELIASQKELRAFVTHQIKPKTLSLEKNLKATEEKILNSIRFSKSPSENIKILAKHQQIASIDELRIAFVKGELESLKRVGKLPSELNLEELKQNLFQYFDLLSQKNALKAATRALEAAISAYGTTGKERAEISKGVYHLLTLERKYDPHLDPRLLIFEAQQFKNFKLLEGGLEQLDLINALLTSSKSLIAAPTGAGKTSVVSVIRSFKKADGKNLVIQKVLPQLLDQTYEQLKDTMAELLGLNVMRFQFDLKTSLSSTEVNVKGEPIQVSYFKKLHQNLEEMIKSRGCILTDYKSIPLLEEFFWKNAEDIQNRIARKRLALEDLKQSSEVDLKEQLKRIEEDYQVDPLLLEHHQYLRKILLLIAEKGDVSMDEPDEKCRPNQSIQIDLGSKLLEGQKIANWMKDVLIEAYEELFSIPELKLNLNLQTEIAPQARQQALAKFRESMAKKYAGGSEVLRKQLLNYFSEVNEEALSSIDTLDLVMRDKIVFVKNLCRKQFFDMVTSKKEGSDYARNKTGKGVVVCHAQRPQPSRHGTLEEQLCYLAQDYLYKGITSYDLVNGLKPLLENNQVTELAKLLPEYPPNVIEKMLNNPQQRALLISNINGKQDSKKFFLRLALNEMKTSGKVISMNPQNILDMSKKNSGVSATMNAPESLPDSLQVDATIYNKVKANMAFRIIERAETQNVISYDPAKPEEMIKKTTTCIIDGAGAFSDPEKAANHLLKRNPQLKKVIFDEKMLFKGESTDDLNKSGAIFPQAFTRGLDRSLSKNTKAVMTINNKTGIRAYYQIEGRLRESTQQYQLAMPEDQLTGASLQDIIREAVLIDARADAKDIFNHITQAIRGAVRKSARERLLGFENIEDFLGQFTIDHRLFIGKEQSNYATAGEYFKKHKYIVRANLTPKEALKELIETEKKNFPFAKKALQEIQLPEELFKKMEPFVASIGNLEDQLGNEFEIDEEMEMEREQEQEAELEVNLEVNQVVSAANFNGIFSYRKKMAIYHLVQNANNNYSPHLYFTENFLPFSRNWNKSYVQREFFDDAMYRVGFVAIDHKNYFPLKMTILDPIVDNVINAASYYDIRTRIFYGPPPLPRDMEEFYKMIAQIRIFDGRCNGWSEEELRGLYNWLWECKNSSSSSPLTEIQEHLTKQVLKNRPYEFPDSQLAEWFEKNKNSF